MINDKKHSGLGIPEGYFSDLEKSILQEVETYELEKELKDKYGEAHGMIIPQNYFENFNPRSNGSAKIFSISKVLTYGSAVAACLVFLFFSGVFSSNVEPVAEDRTVNELLAELSYDDIENLELFNTEELSALIDNENEEDDLDEMLDYLLELEDDLDEITLEILEI